MAWRRCSAHPGQSWAHPRLLVATARASKSHQNTVNFLIMFTENLAHLGICTVTQSSGVNNIINVWMTLNRMRAGRGKAGLARDNLEPPPITQQFYLHDACNDIILLAECRGYYGAYVCFENELQDILSQSCLAYLLLTLSTLPESQCELTIDAPLFILFELTISGSCF